MKDPLKLDIQITDFGLATSTLDAVKLSIQCGTPGFLAPEVINCKSSVLASDIFSIGCLIFRMLNKRNIFQGTSLEKVMISNKNDNPRQLL